MVFLENARKEELNKQMPDARLKLKREMNRANILVEQEVMMKKRNIEQQQAELHQSERMHGDGAEPLDRVSKSTHDDYRVTRRGQQPQSTTVSNTTYSNTTQDNSFQLQYLLETTYMQ